MVERENQEFMYSESDLKNKFIQEIAIQRHLAESVWPSPVRHSKREEAELRKQAEIAAETLQTFAWRLGGSRFSSEVADGVYKIRLRERQEEEATLRQKNNRKRTK